MADIDLPKFEPRKYPCELNVAAERMIIRKIWDIESYLEELRVKTEEILRHQEELLEELYSKIEPGDDGK